MSIEPSYESIEVNVPGSNVRVQLSAFLKAPSLSGGGWPSNEKGATKL